MEDLEKINPRTWYSLSAIVKSKMIPWATSFWSMRKMIVWDQEHGNLLSPMITGEGVGKKYQIKGENIIKFIKKVEGKKIRSK